MWGIHESELVDVKKFQFNFVRLSNLAAIGIMQLKQARSTGI